MSASVKWGRLLIAGGTDFATLGRKGKDGKSQVNDDRPDLPSAHIMRAVANIKFKRVITSHSGCHTVALDIDNQAWIFGRNEHHQLSHPLSTRVTTPHYGVDAHLSPTPAAPYPFLLKSLSDANVPQALKSQGIVEAAVGRGHTLLVTDSGEVWSAGWNHLGQCGHANSEHVSSFTRVGGALLKEKVVAASAGVNFSIFLTESGKCYSVGSGQNGQLGNGKTGEYIAASKVFFTEQSEPLLIRGAIEGKKIVQIASGQQHSLALDSEGFAYAWGFGGLGRLGLGVQADALTPTSIPNFSGPNVLTRCNRIAAGSTNSLFIDAQGMVSLCGKWKTSGDGSSGQPWMTPKLVQDIMGYKWKNITAGGVTLFATTYDNKEGDFSVCWGQGANCGELALGEGSLKSATKPERMSAFDGVTVLDISAGQNTTFFIARPPPTPSELAAVSAPTPPTLAATDSAPAPVATAPAAGIDLSGFGFSFGAPPAALTAEQEKVASNKEKMSLGGENEISRTETEQWEEFLRYPTVLDATDACQICGNEEKDEEQLECEMCENAFHGSCLTPPIVGIPEGEWFCSSCFTSNTQVGGDEEAEVVPAGKKRKAPAPVVKGGKKKKT